MPLQRQPGTGTLLRKTSGKLQNECCCGFDCLNCINLLPSSFAITIDAGTAGDDLGTDAHQSFVATREDPPAAGTVISYLEVQEPNPADDCDGDTSCDRLFFRLSAVCVGSDLVWSTVIGRACRYQATIDMATAGTCNPVGAYPITITNGTGGGTDCPDLGTTDNVDAGQIGTVTIE